MPDPPDPRAWWRPRPPPAADPRPRQAPPRAGGGEGAGPTPANHGERPAGLPGIAVTSGASAAAPSPPLPRPGRGALTVPGRAHELVQHGAHLGLRRHLERAGAGPAESRRQRPTRPEARRGAQPSPSRHWRARAEPLPRCRAGGSGRCLCLALPVEGGAGNLPRRRHRRLASPPPSAPPASSHARHARAPAVTETRAHAP